MQSFNKRKRVTIEDDSVACGKEPMGDSGSKRTRRNLQQQFDVDVCEDHDDDAPPTEEVSSLSASSRVSSGESLHALSLMDAVEPGYCNPRAESLHLPPSPTSATSVVFEFSQVSGNEGEPTTARAAIARNDASAYRDARKVGQVEPVVGERLCQQNQFGAVITYAPLTGSPFDCADQTTKKTHASSNHPLRRSRTALSYWRRWVLGLTVVLCGVRQYSPMREHSTIAANETAIPLDSAQAPRTVYVPGYGFSGFWYILGRLQSIPEPHVGNEFVCYSAGCMGVVATLQNMSMVDIHEAAVRIQNQWKAGEISRYEVVERFVSWLLLPSADDSASTRNMLSSLKIITSAPRQSWAIQPVVRSPSTVGELREMLIQTTWIPFATGGAVWHSEGHNDGAFTWPFHPACDLSIGLTGTNFISSLDLLLNVVNVNLSRRKVEEFWNLGVANTLV